VESWSDASRPEFAYHAESGSQRIRLSVRVKDDPSSLQYRRWVMVDKKGREGGTPIVPKNRRAMKFQLGYNAKIDGGDGSRYGATVLTRYVRQGAVRPRNISGDVLDHVEGEIISPLRIQSRIRNAYRRAYRKVTGRAS
jgi:hypothetical protein